MNIIGGIYRGKKLILPSGEFTRPTSQRAREALMGVLGSRYGFFDVVVEPFAGSGAFSFECLSRRIASQAIMIEKESVVLDILRKNILSFNGKIDVQLIEKDSLTFSKYPMDNALYFIDPPYALSDDLIPQLLDRLSDLSRASLVIVEVEFGADLPSIPSFFQKVDDRTYGRARFLFLKKA